MRRSGPLGAISRSHKPFELTALLEVVEHSADAVFGGSTIAAVPTAAIAHRQELHAHLGDVAREPSVTAPGVGELRREHACQ